MSEEKKVVRNGLVAVILSGGHLSGWFTENEDIPQCLFDPEIVALVQGGVPLEKIYSLARAKWPHGKWGTCGDLIIDWVVQGEPFLIAEYDGNESVKYLKDLRTFTV